MSRELSGFEAFCAGFEVSGDGFNGDRCREAGMPAKDMIDLQKEWEKICRGQEMDPRVRAKLVRQLANYVLDIDKASQLDHAWAVLYADQERLGRTSPRYLLVVLLEGLNQIDLLTDNGSEPVDISRATGLDFYVG